MSKPERSQSGNPDKPAEVSGLPVGRVEFGPVETTSKGWSHTFDLSDTQPEQELIMISRADYDALMADRERLAEIVKRLEHARNNADELSNIGDDEKLITFNRGRRSGLQQALDVIEDSKHE